MMDCLLPPFAALAMLAALSGCDVATTATPAGLDASTMLPNGMMTTQDSGCPTGSPELVKDGWTRSVEKEGVLLEREGAGVELYYSLDITDALRQGSLEKNLWGQFVAPRFSSRAEPVETTDGVLMGPVTEISSGQEAFAGLVSLPSNGVARPVIAFAADEAAFLALFPTAASLGATRAFNSFPLSCALLTGKWTTSSTTAIATYTLSGIFTGLSVAADSLDLAFSTDGRYRQNTSAFVNGAASTDSDEGTFTSSAGEIALAGVKEQTTYDASLVAVQGGWALYIVNRHFTGMAYQLLRSR